MPDQEPIVLFYVPCPDLETATRIGRQLVADRHAACVNILPDMISCYHWKGAIEDARESVLIVKTSRAKVPTVRAALEKAHPYETPAILVLPLEGVNEGYRDWLLSEMA
jgi:periplasmic divalent cation tolerance protein